MPVISGNCVEMTLGNTPANPMNEPNVPMYRIDMIHRCGSRNAAAEALKSALAPRMLSMYLNAPKIAMRMNGTQIQPANGRLGVLMVSPPTTATTAVTEM